MELPNHLIIFCLFSTTLAESFLPDLFANNAFIRNFEQNDNPLRNDRLTNSDPFNYNNLNHNTANSRPNNENRSFIDDRNTDRSDYLGLYDRNDQRLLNNQRINQNVNTERTVPTGYDNQNINGVRNNERDLNNQYSTTSNNVYRNGVTEGKDYDRGINTNNQNVGTDRNDRNIYNQRAGIDNNDRNINTQRNTNLNNNYNRGRDNDQVNNSNRNLNTQNVLPNGIKGGFTNNNLNNARNTNTIIGQENNRRSNNNQNNNENSNDSKNNNVSTEIPEDLRNMTTTEKGVWTSISRGIQKEIRDIKHPVEEGITSLASSQCGSVKKLVGVAYEQIEGEKEPDLNQLTLTFRTRAYTITYNITAAAQLIPEAHNYNPRQNLYIFIHGFTDDPYKNSFGNISEALLKQGECNVLALDGSSLIHWLYLRSTSYVRFMGEKLGEVLAAMVKDGVDPASIHIIGHSLGAHISGFTGKTFQGLTGQKLGRISGLDPAGPCFSHIDEDLRLHATDAEFVDAMHTDAGVFGIKDPVGQVDYYPNEGSQQPNCVFQTCSHSRAWLYYAESVVNPEAFPSVKCQDWEAFKKGRCGEVSYMGFPSKPGAVGSYYLQTGEDSPYGKGQNGTKYVNDESIVKKVSGLIG